jgi:hypothetical protein
MANDPQVPEHRQENEEEEAGEEEEEEEDEEGELPNLKVGFYWQYRRKALHFTC